jgi:hypothetical protein
MALNQLVVTSVGPPTFVSTPPPELTLPDPSPRLAQALRTIGCGRFSDRSVEQYRTDVIQGANRRARRAEDRIDAFEWNLAMKQSDLVAGWLPVLFFCVCAGILIGIPVAFVTNSVMPFTVVRWGGSAGLLVGVATACLHGLQVLRTQRLTPTEVDAHRTALATEAANAPVLAWTETPLSKYKPSIPDPIRSLVWKVATACPHARLIVHHTVVDRFGSAARTAAPLQQRFADPLLEARLGDESYFVAAWEENDHRVAWAWTAQY